MERSGLQTDTTGTITLEEGDAGAEDKAKSSGMYVCVFVCTCVFVSM